MENKTIITVGLASCGISAGGNDVYGTFESLVNSQENILLKKTGCVGACFDEVIVDVHKDNTNTRYAKVTPVIAEKIFKEHILESKIVDSHLFKDDSYLTHQKRIVLRNTGIIDPENIEEYISTGGYGALKKALKDYTPEEVTSEVKKSGLGGRGGAGFTTGLKWELTAKEESDERYIVCNADEGDPGAFMDRSILEGDPHGAIEGLLIAAYAIRATTGYIYVRAEYPLAIKRLRIALQQAEDKGFLGEHILGSNFSFSLQIKIGAGAFVCGEETALLASIEGKRGMPQIKPPYPSTKGVWGKPTVINNVETLANVPFIILYGSENFFSIGSENSKGTKVFALAGKVKNSGLVEVPMGISLYDIIYTIGGGASSGKKVKAVQLGGPSGGCIPESLFHVTIDYKSLKETGAIMGSGGMIVMDEDTCMVDVAKFFMKFTMNESCGKCTFCRLGTKRMYEILEKITSGKGEKSDIDDLFFLAEQITCSSLCGLGQTAPNPVLTTLRYFKSEYEEHILHKKCRAGICKELLIYTILSEKCTGCTLCAKACPAGAISGEQKRVHLIDQEACIKCGKCFTLCNFDAVHKE